MISSHTPLIVFALLMLAGVAAGQAVYYDDPDLDEMRHWRGVADDLDDDIAETRHAQRLRFPRISAELDEVKGGLGDVGQFTSKLAERERAAKGVGDFLMGMVQNPLAWLTLFGVGGGAYGTKRAVGSVKKQKAKRLEAEDKLHRSEETLRQVTTGALTKAVNPERDVGEVADIAAAVGSTMGATMMEKVFNSGYAPGGSNGNGKAPRSPTGSMSGEHTIPATR